MPFKFLLEVVESLGEGLKEIKRVYFSSVSFLLFVATCIIIFE